MYKTSNYNIIFKRNNKTYLWNTISGALIILDKPALDFINSFDGNHTDSEYFNTLKKHGCIIDENINELGKILFDEKVIMMNMNPERLYFTIAPGLGCNYKCDYCFENNRTSFDKMSEEVQEKLIDYVSRTVSQNKNLRRISITWFGGEPLLYVDIIEKLSKAFIEICNNNDIKYYSGMITNGRYLTPDNISKLKKCHIGHMQISVDGMKEYYSKIKKADNKDFETTINNIINASNDFSIAIRININNSYEEALSITDYLLNSKNLDGKIKVYIAHTRDYCAHLSSSEEKILHGKFLDYENEYIKLFGKDGKYKKQSFEFRVPNRRGSSCLSVCQSNACIGPKGEIYQCEHHFGIPELIIGNIEEGRYYSDINQKYLSFQHKDECLECKFFPVCLGGCMDDAVNKRDMINCTKYTERLIDLKLYDFEK